MQSHHARYGHKLSKVQRGEMPYFIHHSIQIMKPISQPIAIILMLFCLIGGITMGSTISSNHYNETLTKRVYYYFGEGDQGEEVLYYLQTGDTTVALEWK